MTGSFLLAVLLSAPPPSGATPPAQGDEQLLKEHKVGDDGPALVAYFRKQTLSEADRRALAETVKRLGHRSFAEREKATRDLLGRGAVAVPYLREALGDPDIEVVRRAEHCLAEIDRGPGPALPIAAARLLARKAPPEAVAVLLAYLPQAAEETVVEAVLDSLVTLTPAKAKPDPALAAALADSAAIRRLAAAHVLGRRGDEAVRPLLKDADVRVRYHAAQALLLGRDRTALPALLALLTEAPTALAWQVEETLF